LKKKVFFLGAKQEVIDALLQVVREKYPNLEVAGAVNGYVPDKDAVFEDIKALQPDIVLVALGIPAQERLIYKHLSAFSKGIFVGVGGSFDVLSGTKERAPKFFINHNLEWLYRLLKEPSRIKRFYNNNIKFLFSVKKK
jgi:N-acetylglucosaminyldiphosphoundecaprenol N-acetyl-beta-D-mannosaminyltransferase